MARSRVVVLGSLNMDQTVGVDRLPPPGATVAGRDQGSTPGGKGLNQAVAAARQGAPVVLVGAVGDDRSGADLLALLAAEGIDRRPVVVRPGRVTGRAFVTVSEGGDNTIVVVGGANADVGPEALDGAEPPLGPDDVLLVQLETPLAAVGAALQRARQVGAVTILNPAPAAAPLPADLLALVDVAVPNEIELAALAPAQAQAEAARTLLDAGVGTVVVTRGARGALIVGRDVATSVASFTVEAVDTTGAGDALCGAVAAAMVAGAPLEAAVRRGTAAGALAVTVRGAVPSLPFAPAVDRLLG